MGWDYGPKPADIKKYLASKLTWDISGIQVKCLDIAIVHARTAYAAIQRTGAVENEGVFAVVVLLDYRKGELGTKFLDETMGPRDDCCPHRIYDLLTPLPEPVGNDKVFKHARNWRARVEHNLELGRQRKDKLQEGNVLVPIQGDAIEIPGAGLFESFTVGKKRTWRTGGRGYVLHAKGKLLNPSDWLLSRLKVKE